MSLPDRSSQTARAVLELRALVLDGTFAPHSRLAETAVAERLDISRTPLRQAMALLVEEGLLERMETGGCRVASFTSRDIEDAIDLRGVLEGMAARLAAERGISQGDAAEADGLLGKLDTAVDAVARDAGATNASVSKGEESLAAYMRLNARFHALIARACGSEIVQREVERASKLPLASPSAFLQGQTLHPDLSASLRLAQAQHRGLIDAITHGEGARAEALAREHARLARQNLRHALEAGPERAARVPGLALVSSA